MKEKNSKSLFWSSVGKLAGLLSVIWIIIQLYNYVFKDNYRIKILGNHYTFELPNIILKDLVNYNKMLAIDSARKVYKETSSFKTLKDFLNYNNHDYYLETYNKIGNYNSNISNYLNYKSTWTFEIKNRGKKPIEELKLELPFDGYYKIIRQNQPVINGLFTKQIILNDLQPSYEIKVTVWPIDVLSDMPEYQEEKTRVTHKYGWTNITYPKEVRGILAWNIRNDNIFTIIAVFVLIIILFIIFGAGMSYGPIYQEQERKRKLQEYNELEKIKKEEEEKVKNEPPHSKNPDDKNPTDNTTQTK